MRNTKKSRQASRGKIIAKAAELFRQDGYSGVTVERIAKAVNLSKVTFYYHWTSKQGLLYEINRNAHLVLLKRLREISKSSASPDLKLRRAIMYHIEVVCSGISPITAALQQEYALSTRYKKALTKLRDEYDKLLRGILSDGVEKGIFVKMNTKLTGFAILGAANYTQHWYSADGPMSKDEVIENMTEYLIRGVLRPDHQQEAAMPIRRE